jgi:hypothetical protein
LYVNVGHEHLAEIIEDDLGIARGEENAMTVASNVSEEDCVRLAAHWETARSASRACKYLVAAAERARSRMARYEALLLLERALSAAAELAALLEPSSSSAAPDAPLRSHLDSQFLFNLGATVLNKATLAFSFDFGDGGSNGQPSPRTPRQSLNPTRVAFERRAAAQFGLIGM